MSGASNPAVVIGRHLHSPPPLLAATRPELAALDPALARALSKEPAERFVTCSQFADALRRAAVPAATPTSQPTPQPTPLPTMQRSREELWDNVSGSFDETGERLSATGGARRWRWAAAGSALVGGSP